jgi:TonB family protein
VGPAFLSSKSKVDNLPLLDFVPMKTIDAAFAGGGSPDAKPPPPAPQPPQPQPPPETVTKPEPVKEIKTVKPDPRSLELTPGSKSRKPEVNTTLVTRPRSTTKQPSSAELEAQARAAAKRRSEQFSSAIHSLREGLSSSTTVEMPGLGGGGPTYANFLQAVKSVYTHAWLVPDGVEDDEATATATVTIARDGTVISARILQLSGNALVDQSVDTVLRRVTVAAPLPDDSKEDQRTVTIKFNVKARRLLG